MTVLSALPLDPAVPLDPAERVFLAVRRLVHDWRLAEGFQPAVEVVDRALKALALMGGSPHGARPKLLVFHDLLGIYEGMALTERGGGDQFNAAVTAAEGVQTGVNPAAPTPAFPDAPFGPVAPFEGRIDVARRGR